MSLKKRLDEKTFNVHGTNLDTDKDVLISLIVRDNVDEIVEAMRQSLNLPKYEDGVWEYISYAETIVLLNKLKEWLSE